MLLQNEGMHEGRGPGSRASAATTGGGPPRPVEGRIAQGSVEGVREIPPPPAVPVPLRRIVG